MGLIVQKYGGTSLADPDRIRRVAERVCATRRAGHDLVVVVSAMGGTTDELASLARDIVPDPERYHPREMDMLLTAGERVAMALVAMAVREAGFEAISFTGSQAAIITDAVHTGARIQEVRADRVRDELERGHIVIVAGFQGVSRAREVTTLGRGGSDTTAAALAAALEAERCEIFTDVEGVFTADPAVVADARRIRRLGYEEMTELAVSGAQVVHPRAVEIVARFGIPLHVRAAHAEDEGTRIEAREPSMEDPAIIGVASENAYARLVLRGLPPAMPVMTELLERLTQAGVSVDLLSQVDGPDGRRAIQLTVRETELEEARARCGDVCEAHGGTGVDERTGLARVTLVGSGMHKRPGVFATVFRLLDDADVPVHDVSASSTTIIVLVDEEQEAEAVRRLHAGFGLDHPESWNPASA